MTNLDEARLPKNFRITSKTSNKSLARLAKRKDSLGVEARAVLKRRYAARDSVPKVSQSLKQLTDRLIAGRTIDPDLLVQVKKASPKSITAVANKAKKERERNLMVDKAKKETRRDLETRHKADIRALKKKLKGIGSSAPKTPSTVPSRALATLTPRPTEPTPSNPLAAMAKALLSRKGVTPTNTVNAPVPYEAPKAQKPVPAPKPAPPPPKSKPVGKAEAVIAARMYELKNLYKDFNGPEPDDKEIFQELMGHMSPEDAEEKVAEFKKMRKKAWNDWFHSI
jgi:hypothetical protein